MRRNPKSSPEFERGRVKHRPGSEGNVATFGGTSCAMVPHSTISPKVVLDASKKVSHILLYTLGYYVTLRSLSLLVFAWSVSDWNLKRCEIISVQSLPKIPKHDGAQLCFKTKIRERKKIKWQSLSFFSLSCHTLVGRYQDEIKSSQLYFLSKELSALQRMCSNWWAFSCKESKLEFIYFAFCCNLLTAKGLGALNSAMKRLQMY